MHLEPWLKTVDSARSVVHSEGAQSAMNSPSCIRSLSCEWTLWRSVGEVHILRLLLPTSIRESTPVMSAS